MRNELGRGGMPAHQPPTKLMTPKGEKNRSISEEDKQWLLDKLGLSGGAGCFGNPPLFDPVMFKRVDELKLSVRTTHFLRNNSIICISDLVQKSEAEMLRAPNLGRKSLNEINEALLQMGLHLGMEERDWPLAKARSLRSVMFKRIDELELSVRTANCLRKDGIVYIGDLVPKSEVQMLRGQNFGRAAINEIKAMLMQIGLHLDMELRDWPRGRIIYAGLIANGMAYASKGQQDRAIADFDAVIRINPRDVNVLYLRGKAHFDKGDHRRAIADYSEAIRLIPKDAVAF